MKVSQEGIEEVKKDPELMKAIQIWVTNGELECPLSLFFDSAPCNPEILCQKIFPELEKEECPCSQYPESEVMQIAKQIVGDIKGAADGE